MEQQQETTTRLSEAMAQPLIAAYRAGGLALTFLVLGSAMLVWSGEGLGGPSRYVVLALGLALIALPAALFYVEQVRPIARAQRAVYEHREMVDSVQDMAVALTELTLQMQALAFKHADDVTRAIAAVRPVLDKIPAAERLTSRPPFSRAGSVSRAIVASAAGTERVLEDVRIALMTSDPTLIREYVGKVTALRDRTVGLLAASDEPVGQ